MSKAAISGIEVRTIAASPKTEWRHIILTDTDGRSGVGEYSHYRAATDIDGEAEATARTLTGKPGDRSALEEYRNLVNDDITPASIYSALEQALVDLEAQRADLPIWQYLSGSSANRRETVALYANINRRTIERSPENCAKSARAAQDAGYHAVKIAPFDGLAPDICQTEEGQSLIEAGLERVTAIRTALEPDIRLMVDCHWRFVPDAAQAILPRLAEAGVTWFECPLTEVSENIPAIVELRHLANDAGMELAGLEKKAGLAGTKKYIDAGAYDVIMPDIKHAGGYADILQIADYAQQHGVAISLHNPSGPIAHLASVHAMAVLGNDQPLEIQFDESPLFWTITDPPPEPCPGSTTAPKRVGLGACLNSRLQNPAG